MKATLEFDLPTEQAEFDAALEGQKWKSVCEQLRMFIRNQQKHDDHSIARMAFGEVSEKLYTLVDEAGLSFD
jgi:hypothetical protein